MTPPEREPPGTGCIAITGASRGIGAAVALELAQRGFSVACLTRAGQGIEEGDVPPELTPRLRAIRCDVTDEAALKQALAEAAQGSGGLRGLINNAGFHSHGASAELPTAELRRVLETNVTALFVACREAYPHLKARGGGLIVNMGSFFDHLGITRNLAYTASKAAVAGITRCLAVEWAAEGIRVLNVAPGYIETNLNRDFLRRPSVQDYLLPRIPVGRTGTPEEVARLIAVLYAEDLTFLTGETIYIDGAQGIAH
ncbi:MAG TPA: SDR family oxidoreductase [bacterium]|nr:SDR family oxidoreductase [bacterium]